MTPRAFARAMRVDGFAEEEIFAALRLKFPDLATSELERLATNGRSMFTIQFPRDRSDDIRIDIDGTTVAEGYYDRKTRVLMFDRSGVDGDWFAEDTLRDWAGAELWNEGDKVGLWRMLDSVVRLMFATDTRRVVID